jgi:hypothetical protein
MLQWPNLNLMVAEFDLELVFTFVLNAGERGCSYVRQMQNHRTPAIKLPAGSSING